MNRLHLYAITLLVLCIAGWLSSVRNVKVDKHRMNLDGQTVFNEYCCWHTLFFSCTFEAQSLLNIDDVALQKHGSHG